MSHNVHPRSPSSFQESSALAREGVEDVVEFLGSKAEREVVLHLFHGPREKGTGQGSVPLVLEVKSQGQLEVKLDCPTLMGPTQGIAEVHVNLEETEGRT